MKRNKVLLILLILLSACSSFQKTNYSESKKELEYILDNKNIDNETKIIIKHAITDLEIADKTQTEAVKLQKDLVKESKSAGRMAYTFILSGVVILLIITKIILKLKK